MKRLRVLLIVFWITYAFAQLTCEEECEQGIEVKTKTLFCGTDGKEHLISYEHEMQRVARCYNEKCNITAFTPGHCECPNYCYQGLGKGLCYQGQCHCYKGWTGKDCSSMECPNTCSNHGKCVQGEKEGLIATYCHCEEGWTGDDCATPIDNFSRIPYGEFFGPEDSDEGFHHINKKDSGYWHKRDRYKDHHPLFHFEQIASINIQISEENFKNLLAPSNKWSQDFWNCSVFIDNAHKERNSQPTDQLGEDFSKHDRGHVTRVINNVGMRLKGTATREYLKKSFKLKFNTIPEDFMEHVLNKPDDNSPDRKRRFFELKKLGIKAPFHDDSFIKNQIMAEFYRAWEIPTARASFASLSINGLHWGLFWIHEAMDDVFISAHYEDYNGNYYKAGCGGSYLVYLGEDPERYKNASKEWRDTVRPFIYQKQGNGDWSDIVHMISVLYKTKSEDFAREIQKVVDVEKYLRYLVIETAVCNTDDYTRNGNNWKLYKNPETGLFEMHGFDWDITFRSTKCSIWGGDERAQLTHRILKIPEFRERYMRLMNLFINKIWTSKTLKDRITRWKDFILNEVRKDYNYRLDFSRSEMDMQKEIDYMLNFIPSRYENIKEQLKEAGFKDVDHAEADEKARHELHSALVLTILAGGGVCGLALIYLSHIVKNYTKVRAKAMLHGHHHRNQNDNNGYHTYHL